MKIDNFLVIQYPKNMTNTELAPSITQIEFSIEDFPIAEVIACRLGYTQTAYTSTSGLWGLFCLRDKASDKAGCVIKTKEFGFMFVQDLEDLNMYNLKEKIKELSI